MSSLFQSRYREVTVSSLVFGVVLGAIMNVAITYAGLKIGFTITGSAIAAVLGFGVLRGILRKGSILETNIAQSIASTVNISNSGIIFTVPVLYLLEIEVSPARFWMIALASVVGALLGAAFIIPLRKQMIDIDRLRFPSATAVAAILRSPGAGAKKSLVLVVGAVMAAAVYLPAGLPTIKIKDGPDPTRTTDDTFLPGYGDLSWRLPDPRAAGIGPLPRRVDRDGDQRPDLVLTHEELDVGRWLGFPDQMKFMFAIAPLSFGAGYLTGRAGLMVLAGSVLAYLVINPTAFAWDWLPSSLHADEVAGFALGAINRPLGIGMLLGGALLGVAASFPAIREAFKSIRRSSGSAAGAEELGLRVLSIAVGLAFVALFTITHLASDQAAGQQGLLGSLPPLARSLIVAVVGTAWIWFAGVIISQCTGMTDWSPISGISLLTVVLMMVLMGSGNVVGAVMLGAVLCVATTCASDMMSDLKTGHLVGAQPRRQQVVELLTVWMGPLISMGTLLLIVEANRRTFNLPIGPGTSTSAPQAQALKVVVEGVNGGQLPYALYGVGAVLGAFLGLGAFAGLGVLVGLSMYLPPEYMFTYGLGCLANMAVGKLKGRDWAEEWGVPFCAGMVVGEALLAVSINLVVLFRS